MLLMLPTSQAIPTTIKVTFATALTPVAEFVLTRALTSVPDLPARATAAPEPARRRRSREAALALLDFVQACLLYPDSRIS
ncbi:hypothetical protein GCM10009734_71980 [Nonomuraea bangladeshensis]